MNTTVRRFTIGAASLGFLVALGIGPAPDAGAQTTPPPTSPCPGCGPSSGRVPGADRAYAWPDHHCLPDGTSAYSVTFGLGKNAGSATFYAWENDTTRAATVLGTLQPGEERVYYPLATISPGETISIDIIARDANGRTIPFGDGSQKRTFTLTCDCVQPPTTTPPSTAPATTVPTSSTPSSPPPTVTGSSVPPGVTTPPSSSPGGTTNVTTPANVVGQLPATGSSSAEVVTVAGLLLIAGAGLGLLARRRNVAE